MFKEEKNIKDPEGKSMTSYGAGSQSVSVISYSKTNKLITALYMVTDIIDKDEPLRNKLRTLGTGIISDMNVVPSNICSKISEIMSFLDIASAVNIISEMNYSILKKEFLELDQSIKESIDNGSEARPNMLGLASRSINLSEFFRDSSSFENLPHPNPLLVKERGNSKGHTRIGVQKGSTLMKALSGITSHAQDFDTLKKQRRNDIISIIKAVGGNATIKDIKDRAQSLPAGVGSLLSCSEKTLQRELISMVKDNVLNKVGEKRWSRYFLKN